MKNFEDKDIIMSAVNEEKGLCRFMGYAASEAVNSNLIKDFSSIASEAAELSGKLTTELLKRGWSQLQLATAERKNAVFKSFSHLSHKD